MRHVAIVVLALIALIAPASAAAPVYPGCAHYMMKGAPHNCGFVSFEQCLVSVRGIGGTCNRNPFYDEPRRLSRKSDGTR